MSASDNPYLMGDLKKVSMNYSTWRTAGLVSTIILGLGAILPWGYVYSEKVGGLDGDGNIILGIAILALVLLLIKKVPIWISLILGLLAMTIGIIDIIEIYKVTKDFATSRIGEGMYITIIGSAGLVVGTIAEMSQKK